MIRVRRVGYLSVNIFPWTIFLEILWTFPSTKTLPPSLIIDILQRLVDWIVKLINCPRGNCPGGEYVQGNLLSYLALRPPYGPIALPLGNQLVIEL